MLQLYINIKNRRKELGYTQTELAHKLGYADKSMIAKIEKGEVDLSQSKILAFADALQTTPSNLMGWDEKTRDRKLPSNLIPISKAKAIPIIGTICAGTGLVAFEERLGVFSLDANIHADYSLYVKGNSMIGADIQDGDLAFFERDFEYEDGAIYAVLRKDTEEAILRRVTVADGKMVCHLAMMISCL